jgi:N-acetylneuraminic acid mutarotase
MIAFALAIGLVSAGETTPQDQFDWTRLPSLPGPHGFAGMFVGTSGGALVVAGGANFPDRKPWEGGAKVWHEDVFVLVKSDGVWKCAGKLPRPLAYGASAGFEDWIYCVGGSDATRHHSDAFRLRWKDGNLQRENLPPLPFPIANGCGAVVGRTLFVSGGQSDPAGEALDALLALDLGAPGGGWRTHTPRPGAGRILATAASAGGEYWSIGGVELSAGRDGKQVRKYLKDVQSFKEGRGWRRRADLPRPLAASPSPAAISGGAPVVFSGDDGTQNGIDLERHRGFTAKIWRYDVAAECWREAGTSPAPRVTTGIAAWADGWAIPSGEVRPGVRSPETWLALPKK